MRDAVVQNGDALGRIVMRYDYDMLGNRIHQASMEAGERWMLNDVTGKPIRAWDSRGHQFRTAYDDSAGLPIPSCMKARQLSVLVGESVYGETRPNPEANNLRGKVFRCATRRASSPVTSTISRAICCAAGGNWRRITRQRLTGPPQCRWKPRPTRAARPTMHSIARLTVTTPDGSVYRPTFNEANLLDKVDVNLRGAATATSFVTNINYNAKGQRELIAYGNGAKTAYEYDPLTFRLTRLRTTRAAALNGLASQIFTDPAVVQDLRYTYDPAGNITHIEDAALKTIFHDGKRWSRSATTLTTPSTG